ncbi:AAA family ATPase [Plesiocystis pacifica]|uniref:AAA family ATPase n=1 Tax=Plesiocystis pacifica TaxID=191768 RepID=UPI0012FA8542|nr:AAA family ATPase [Plesiocystis pacifica]
MRASETLELLQLGIGPHLRDVSLIAAAGGHLSLALELDGVGHVSAYQLSDGQLTYLAFVALVQLDEGRTLLCFDEPEQHLHPELLGRVVQLLVAASERYPVVLATHSDHILDLLPDPVSSVRVCELDDNHQTVLRKLDAEQLEKWLERYRGLGEIRAAGQLRSVLAERESA